ncbi:MAG: PcfJ domain-containing protein [Crocinitomicaceae bacterium]
MEEYNKDNEIYKIEELNTRRKLSEEGKALKHCVFSYIEDCMKHSSIILGLRKKVNEGFVPWVSFETNGGFILQAYGYKNRDITENEKEIITEWAKMNDVVWEL